MRPLLVLLAAVAGTAQAAVSFDVCFNYGCAANATVTLADGRLAYVRELLESAPDAVAERDAIARAVGLMYRLAGEQSPIASDRAGNYLDGGVNGRMDCIDHSTTTTRLLAGIAARGWMRFHRVIEPARRTRFIFQHFSAVIEETGSPPARPAAPLPVVVPDHVAPLLALCDCAEVLGDIPRPPEPAPAVPGAPGARFAVDSWFVDHGERAVVLPLAEWLNGEGPNVQ